MTTYLSRLVDRTLGRALVVQPIIAPRFSQGPELPAEGWITEATGVAPPPPPGETSAASPAPARPEPPASLLRPAGIPGEEVGPPPPLAGLRDERDSPPPAVAAPVVHPWQAPGERLPASPEGPAPEHGVSSTVTVGAEVPVIVPAIAPAPVAEAGEKPRAERPAAPSPVHLVEVEHVHRVEVEPVRRVEEHGEAPRVRPVAGLDRPSQPFPATPQVAQAAPVPAPAAQREPLPRLVGSDVAPAARPEIREHPANGPVSSSSHVVSVERLAASSPVVSGRDEPPVERVPRLAPAVAATGSALAATARTHQAVEGVAARPSTPALSAPPALSVPAIEAAPPAQIVRQPEVTRPGRSPSPVSVAIPQGNAREPSPVRAPARALPERPAPPAPVAAVAAVAAVPPALVGRTPRGPVATRAAGVERGSGRAEARAAAAPGQAPVIRVHVGRIDVRAVASAPAPAAPTAPTGPRLTLSEYLEKQRRS